MCSLAPVPVAGWPEQPEGHPARFGTVCQWEHGLGRAKSSARLPARPGGILSGAVQDIAASDEATGWGRDQGQKAEQ